MARVIDDEQLYGELLVSALEEYLLFRKKYERLRELQPLFRVGDGIAVRVKKTLKESGRGR